jgi:hypothetical protein
MPELDMEAHQEPPLAGQLGEGVIEAQNAEVLVIQRRPLLGQSLQSLKREWFTTLY